MAIVEGTLEVSKGHGPWRTVLGTEMGAAEAGTAPRATWYGGKHIWGLEQGSRRASGRNVFKRWVG